MLRILLICLTLCVTSCGHKLQADDDRVEKKLKAAHAAYDDDIKDFKTDALRWFDREEKSARRSRTGATEQIQQIQVDRTQFEKFWVLPARAPKKLIDTPTNAADELIAAYKTAADEYSRLKQDDKAVDVQKRLDELLASDKLVGDFRDGNFTEVLNGGITDNVLLLGTGKIILTPTCSVTEAIQKNGKLDLTISVATAGQTIEFVDLQNALVGHDAEGAGPTLFKIEERSRKLTLPKRAKVFVQIKAASPN